MGFRYQGTETEALALGSYIKLQRAADSVSSRALKHLLQAKLSTSQFGVLECLYHLGPLCQRDIGRKILKSSGNISTVIDNLEKRGYVSRQRSDEDRRYIKVDLTENGKNLISGIFPQHVEEVVSQMNILTAREQHQLSRLCKKLGRP
ncbi:MAG TPA: MarR family transcriptional regulator [Geopsychrobacteraceae bacterium]|nr:MarR family transcriptional regulator [Geopsychrobacteraceae bacterium]